MKAEGQHEFCLGLQIILGERRTSDCGGNGHPRTEAIYCHQLFHLKMDRLRDLYGCTLNKIMEPIRLKKKQGRGKCNFHQFPPPKSAQSEGAGQHRVGMSSQCQGKPECWQCWLLSGSRYR